MKNAKYIPNKEKMNLFVEFIKENPNGNYLEYKQYMKHKEAFKKILDNL